MEKSKQIKRNHHYVWSYYLKSWAKDNNVHYISKKGKIAFDSVKGLAKDVDFYKISPLRDEDVAFIKRLSSRSPKFLQDEHMAHLNQFIHLSRISNFISDFELGSREAENIDKAIRHNSLENLHTIFEGAAVEVIFGLANGNVEVLNSKSNMIAFCSYIGQQIARTKAFKERSIGVVKEKGVEHSVPEQLILLWEKNWWFISFMFGLNIGMSLYESKDRDNHIYISNNTDIPFITSDSPIINIHRSVTGLGKYQAPIYADFYFPLSPNHGYMINNSNDYNYLSSQVDLDIVNYLNAEIYKKSDRTIFGNSESVLHGVRSS